MSDDQADLISAARDAVTAWRERQGSPPARFVDAMLALERVVTGHAVHVPDDGSTDRALIPKDAS